MRKIFFVTLIFLSTLSSFGQGKMKEKVGQVKSLKVAYITNELSLTPDESAKFWPVYNDFESKQREIRRKKIGKFLDRYGDEKHVNISEKEAEAILDQLEAEEDQLHQLRKKFTSDLKKVLPSSKILRLKKAEENFSRKLLKQYREKGRR